jgi:hypothetical protein
MDWNSLTFSGEEGDCNTLSTCTPCSTNTVNIVFRIVWVVIVQHMSNVPDIFNERVSNLQQQVKTNGPLFSRVMLQEVALSKRLDQIHLIQVHGTVANPGPGVTLEMQLEQCQESRLLHSTREGTT